MKNNPADDSEREAIRATYLNMNAHLRLIMAQMALIKKSYPQFAMDGVVYIGAELLRLSLKTHYRQHFHADINKAEKEIQL